MTFSICRTEINPFSIHIQIPSGKTEALFPDLFYPLLPKTGKPSSHPAINFSETWKRIPIPEEPKSNCPDIRRPGHADSRKQFPFPVSQIFSIGQFQDPVHYNLHLRSVATQYPIRRSQRKRSSISVYYPNLPASIFFLPESPMKIVCILSKTGRIGYKGKSICKMVTVCSGCYICIL